MKSHFLYILFIGFFSYNCTSQNTSRRYLPLELIQHDANVNAPFSSTELLHLNEVYGASLDKEILSRPNRVLAEPYALCDDNVETASSYMPIEGGIYTLEVFDALLTTQCAAAIEVFTVTESSHQP